MNIINVLFLCLISFGCSIALNSTANTTTNDLGSRSAVTRDNYLRIPNRCITAETNINSEKKELSRVIKVVKKIFSTKDKNALEKLLKYPFTIDVPEGIKTIANKEEFLSLNLSKLFTVRVIKSIESTNEARLFCNYQGVRMARGVVWIRRNFDTHKYQVISLSANNI